MTEPDPNKPLRWIPSLYFAECLPYVSVMTLSVAIYNSRGGQENDPKISRHRMV